MTSFSELALIEPLQRNVAALGYDTPTPIQAQAIPALLRGRDLLGCAQTGTGKTAAFALPLLQRLATSRQQAGRRACRALILTPTRELAVQVGTDFAAYGGGLRLSQAVIFGGVGYGPQIKAAARGVDIVIATPGRLLDLIGQGHLRLDEVRYLVLDEADRMLDMGFIRPIRQILSGLPSRRQTAFFSATMAGEARELADEILVEPVHVSVAPAATPIELVEQQLVYVEQGAKRERLGELLAGEAVGRVLVFTRTKHGANRLSQQLARDGEPAQAIHGNKSQSARQRALDAFRSGDCRVLVATDVAARGLDVDGITHVVNFDLPDEPDSYVHRIGRTGRAGATGTAVSFCSPEERTQLRDIERLIQQRIPVVGGEPPQHERPRSRPQPRTPRSNRPQAPRQRSRHAAAGD